MWLYPGPSYLGRPSSEEFGVAEIITQIHKVLDLGANPNPEAGPAPLGEGVASTRVRIFGHVLMAYAILSFHCACGLAQGLGRPQQNIGHQSARGRGEVGGETCLQRGGAGIERGRANLGRRPPGGVGTGVEHPHWILILRRRGRGVGDNSTSPIYPMPSLSPA
jgi:hypothetical protein